MAVEVRGVLFGVTGVPSLPGVPVDHKTLVITHSQTAYTSEWALLHIHICRIISCKYLLIHLMGRK